MSYIHIVRDMPSPDEGSTRTVRIYTPDAYDVDRAGRFPVLYMHDGQNVFAHPESAKYDTWCANLVLEGLVSEGRIQPWIIVAVDHGPGRFEEYSPWERAPLYARFLVERLKPYIDRTYRTLPEGQWTGTLGASLGGLVSLYLSYTHPSVFGRIGALSPTVMWNGSRLFQDFAKHPRKWTRIYLDAGAGEHITVNGQPLDYAARTRDFYLHLKQLGYGDHELCLLLEPGGEHHENDWRRRLPFAFRWLLA